MEWKQEKPSWCMHSRCIFLRQSQNSICAGKLPEIVAHKRDFNTHRICLAGVLANTEIFDLQVNVSDLYNLRRILDAIDGRGVGSRHITQHLEPTKTTEPKTNTE